MLTSYDAPPETPSLDFILQQESYLRGFYAERNKEYKVLRDLFRGDFASAQQSKLIPAIFNDRIEIVYNIINAVVRRQVDSMSQPPRLECLPRGIEDADTTMADAKSKLLEWVYKCNRMPVRLLHAAWYQSLLDKAVFHVCPDPDMPCKVRIEVVIPEAYMPAPAASDWMSHPYIIYSFTKLGGVNTQVVDSSAMEYTHDAVVQRCIVYWDAKWFIRIEDGKEVVRIKHNFGTMPWFLAHNFPIPHQFRGQGDCDQAVGLNVYLNRLISNEAQIIDYASNPIIVIRGAKNGAGNLPNFPGAQWELRSEGQAQFLQWAGTPPAVEAQRLWTMQAIEDVTSVNSAAFGRDIPSGVSGSAVRSLTAGYNSRIGTKQTLMGDALVQLNEAILMILEKTFPNEEFEVIGESQIGSRQALKVKPKDFKGWYENTVIFEPFDPTMKFFQEIQKLDKGLQSRWTTMRQLGIRYPSEELQRIQLERQGDLEHTANVANAEQGNYVNPNENPLDLSGLRLPPGVVVPKGEKKDSPMKAGTYEPVPGMPAQDGTEQRPLPRADLNKIFAQQAEDSGPRFRGNVALLNDPGQGGNVEVMVSDQQDAEQVKRMLGGVGRPVNISVGAPPPDAQLLARARNA